MIINRVEIHEKYNGHCAYCGKEITIKEMQIDHIQPKEHGGTEDFDNLNPSCRACNFYKSSSTLEVFRSELGKILERLTERSFIYRTAKRYGLISENREVIKFYFEKYKKL